MPVLVGRFKTAPYGLPQIANRTASIIPWEIQKLGEINHAAADQMAGTVERAIYQAMLKARQAIDLKALADLLDEHDTKTASENVGSLWASRIAQAVQLPLHKVVVESGKTASRTFLHKSQISYEAETARIKERAKQSDAKEPHRFKAATWTHPNGHPRCRTCGQEQPMGGRCNMPAEWYAKSPEAQAELALISIDVKYPALAGAVALADEPTAGLAFDLLNPRALEAARTITAQLVREVTDETKAAIQQIMGYSFENGLAPRQAARLIQQSVGLTNRQASSLMKYRDALKGQPRMSAAKLDARTDAQASRLLRRRANLIARTETIRASTAGQQALWRSASDRGLFSKDQAVQVWIATHGSPRTDELCLQMDGETAPIDGPFTGGPFSGIDGPPGHPACRCTVGLQFGDPNQQLNPPQVDEDLPDVDPWTPLLDKANDPDYSLRQEEIYQDNQKTFTSGEPRNGEDRTRMNWSEVQDKLAAASGLQPYEVSHFVGDWNFSSQEGRSLVLQNAVAEKFGMKLPAYLQAKLDKYLPVGHPEYGDARTFVDAVYAMTQKQLKELGISEVHVTRGLHWSIGKRPNEFGLLPAASDKAIAINTNPLSSWSFDESQAGGFANGNGAILTATVPAERIFSLWWSGTGTYDEQEVVTIGGEITVGGRKT